MERDGDLCQRNGGVGQQHGSDLEAASAHAFGAGDDCFAYHPTNGKGHIPDIEAGHDGKCGV